jgi:ribosomal protein S18 acetylase RimI-like enzyme
MMRIKKLIKHDAEHYRNIRLKALSDIPDAFGTMYAEEVIKTTDNFREHKAYIRSMYVQPECRKKGIGKLLLNELIERTKAIKEVEILLLDVITNNLSAKQLYLSFGF